MSSITDKIGKLAKCNNRIVVANIKWDDNFNPSPVLHFATILQVYSNKLAIKYDSGLIDSEYQSNDFIIIDSNAVSFQLENNERINKVRNLESYAFSAFGV